MSGRRLAGRIWRKRNEEPARERKAISQNAQNVAVHVRTSRRAVIDFLDGVHDDAEVVDDG